MRLPKDHAAAKVAKQATIAARLAKGKAELRAIEQEQLRQVAKFAKAVGATDAHPFEIMGALVEAARKLESEPERKRLYKVGEEWFRRRVEERKKGAKPEQGGSAGGEGVAAEPHSAAA